MKNSTTIATISGSMETFDGASEGRTLDSADFIALVAAVGGAVGSVEGAAHEIKTLILTDERTGGTSLLYIINSFASKKYSGLDDIHSLFENIKKGQFGWIENIINDNIKNYLLSIENVEDIDYFELLTILFDNGINTYKLSCSSITNVQYDNLLYKLKNNNDNITIINLVRENRPFMFICLFITIL